MDLSPFLSPQGEPIFTAGGRHSLRQEQYRGLVASLEWMKPSRKVIRALVIWPQGFSLSPTASVPGMWAIGEQALQDFVGFDRDGKCTGGASEHCYRECLAALPILGYDVNDKAAFVALVDTVVKFAPEVITMPAPSEATRRALAGDEAMWDIEAINKATGKTIREASV